MKIINHKNTIFALVVISLGVAYMSGNYFNHKAQTDCVHLFSDEKYLEAVEKCTPLSKEGDGAASLILGKIYAEGWSINKNFEKSYSEYSRAVNSKDLKISSEAKAGIGDLYKDKYFSQYDLMASYKWFESAAADNHPRSQLVVGAMLYVGQGTVQDVKLAKEYLLKAAQNGEKQAEELLASIDN